jgi:hypothetical protein
MEEGESFLVNFEEALDTVADAYSISRDPADYVLIPVRANSADRYNANLDTFLSDELLRFDPNIGRRVYQTYDLKPSFVNHQADNIKISRGVVLDSHWNDINEANDEVKTEVFEAVGREASTDDFVECLIAIDASKDPPLAKAYRNGSVNSVSMGCDVTHTACSYCGNTATATWNFCDHIRSKHARRPLVYSDGRTAIAHELCCGTIFQEISTVDDPADKSALVQEEILEIPKLRVALNESQVNELVGYVAQNFSTLPESLAMVINKVLNQ